MSVPFVLAAMGLAVAGAAMARGKGAELPGRAPDDNAPASHQGEAPSGPDENESPAHQVAGGAGDMLAPGTGGGGTTAPTYGADSGERREGVTKDGGCLTCALPPAPAPAPVAPTVDTRSKPTLGRSGVATIAKVNPVDERRAFNDAATGYGVIF